MADARPPMRNRIACANAFGPGQSAVEYASPLSKRKFAESILNQPVSLLGLTYLAAGLGNSGV
jgi:hypothetical protein